MVQTKVGGHYIFPWRLEATHPVSTSHVFNKGKRRKIKEGYKERGPALSIGSHALYGSIDRVICGSQWAWPVPSLSFKNFSWSALFICEKRLCLLYNPYLSKSHHQPHNRRVQTFLLFHNLLKGRVQASMMGRFLRFIIKI